MDLSSDTSIVQKANGDASLFKQPQVVKRDGQTVQAFDYSKIETAIRKAWLEADIKSFNEDKLHTLTMWVVNTLPTDTVTVEMVQDAVEVALMRNHMYSVAKAYIVYRQRHADMRKARLNPDALAVSSYIHFSKYARYLPEQFRRELYGETIDRVEAMHLRRFAHVEGLENDIRWAFDQVRDKRVLPSMRSMQFGGKAIESNHNRVYNCSFTFIDRPRAFAEAMFLLLSGCGVGYSVQYDHVDKLPALGFVDPKQVVHHVVADSIEGWADALDALIQSYISGVYLEFSFHQIRAAGTPLKTSGGRAPGHIKLKLALEAIRSVLDGAQGRKLRPIECHDMLCHGADAVLSGGIRRSAMISLFSLEDSEMMNAKTGNWYAKHPYRENANNSVAIRRDDVKKKMFKRIFQMIRDWGEPGFFFCSDNDYGTNPCGEIGLNPKLVVNDEVIALLMKRRLAGKSAPVAVSPGESFSGWAFCNLCEINAAKFTSFEDFMIAAKAAAIIGTLQASYTDMPYLGWVSEVIAEREALLGIGMTGMMDAPQISLNAEMQRTVAGYVKLWNEEYAAKIGILPAARTTCVKPSGTTSLELGSVGSGHHAHHASRYIRRVTADEYEVGFQIFKSKNPHMCVRKPNGKWVIEFPVQAPEGAILREHLGATQFLEMVRSTQLNWVLPGTARPDSSPGLNHNVSNTVTVKDGEWDTVADYIWDNRIDFTGITLISDMSDKKYSFAPNEAITTEADEARWNQLIANYVPVDYTAIIELEDGTALTSEAACAAGGCVNV